MVDKSEGIIADTKKLTGIAVNGKSLMDIVKERKKKIEAKRTLEVRKTTPGRKKTSKKTNENSGQKEITIR